IAFAAPADTKFGEADFEINATASSKLNVSLTASGNCSVNGTKVHVTGAGQCTITASQDGNADYNAATPVARMITVAKAEQQITFDALPNRNVGDADFNVSATVSSNLPVAFLAEGNCRLTGTLVHLTAPGLCLITASQDGNADYNRATAVARSFTITANNQTLIDFSTEVYHVTEKLGVLRLAVLRSGHKSGSATVDYATDDTGAAVDCAKLTGMASARCDFNTALGTLTFAPGETEKTFDVLINQDSYVESPFEAFTVKLSNPTGAALGTTASATVQ